MSRTPLATEVGGPFYDELQVGQRFDGGPSVTLTDGLAAAHQALIGDRLRLSLDHVLSARVTKGERAVAHPALIWDIAIGQSTGLTQRVIANLFYRGLELRRACRLGDTLRTEVEVVALRDASAKVGQAPRGLAALRIRTWDQADRAVLDFHRCAMLPTRPGVDAPGHADGLDSVGADIAPLEEIAGFARGWELAPLRSLSSLRPGARLRLATGDTVSGATELARLTLNVAGAHHDKRHGTSDGRRLVYGGHTIGLATSQVCRALPEVVYIAAWRSCDHLGPVYEQDLLVSEIEFVDSALGAGGISVVELEVTVYAVRGAHSAPVLKWRPVVLAA